ncbi:ABC transporter permease, partial [Enterococcus faecalis]
IGILLSALLVVMLKLGGQGMPLIAGLPTELVDVVIEAIIFFVGISYLILLLLEKASCSKKEVSIVETIEAAPDKNNHEGGDI